MWYTGSRGSKKFCADLRVKVFKMWYKGSRGPKKFCADLRVKVFKMWYKGSRGPKKFCVDLMRSARALNLGIGYTRARRRTGLQAGLL